MNVTLIQGLFVATAALLLTLHTAAADSSPLSLPHPIRTGAQPMPGPSTDHQPAEFASAETLWQILEIQRHGTTEEIVAAWTAVRLPSEMEAWRHVALGVAWLDRADLQRAESELTIAVKIDPENALAHYFTGLLRLEQSWRALDWLDKALTDGVQLAAGSDDRPSEVANPSGADSPRPGTRRWYEQLAITELDQAVTLAAFVQAERPLTWHRAAQLDGYPPRSHKQESPTSEFVTSKVAVPRVADLVEAMDAGEFLPNAHSRLGFLHLSHRRFASAEHHFDAATHFGADVRHGYYELGRAWNSQPDVERVFGKATAGLLNRADTNVDLQPIGN